MNSNIRFLIFLIISVFTISINEATSSESNFPPCAKSDSIKRHNCFGSREWVGGEIYTGEWVNGGRHGQGTMTFSNGDVYEGIWEWGQKSEGTLTYSNGEKYIGKFNRNMPHGQGVYYFADGTREEGEFKHGRLNGHGARYKQDGSIIDMGIFRNGTLVQRKAVSHLQTDTQVQNSPGKAAASTAPSRPIDAGQDRKVAFVVGIDNYDNLPKLLKAVNDSRAIARTLSQIGYEVTHIENPMRRNLSSALVQFMNGIQVGDTAFFYFAGHGIAIGPNNILMAADMPRIQPGEEDIAKDEGFLVDTIVRRLQNKGAKTSFVVLDACRNNPFEGGGTRSVGNTRGLGRTEAPEGVFVLYSAGIGQEAIDQIDPTDTHPNSVFTRKLVDALVIPSITHTSLAKQVQLEVSRLAASANMKQQPAYYDQIIGEVSMNPFN